MAKRFNNIQPVLIRRYPLLSATLLAIILGLAFQLVSWGGTAHWLLGAVSLVAVVLWVIRLYDNIRTGSYGSDILPIVSVMAAVILDDFWAAIILVLAVTAAKAVSDYAARQAKRDLAAVLGEAPQRAQVIRGKKVVDTPLRLVRAGDRLALSLGDIVPVDGVVLDGAVEIDESRFTHTPGTVTKSVGERLLSGSRVVGGNAAIKAAAAANQSNYHQASRLIRSALGSHAPEVRRSDVHALIFTGFVFIVGGVAWALSRNPDRFLGTLAIATAAPLLVGPSLAIIAGINRLFTSGVIIRTAKAFEQLARAKTVAFGKTGTLTESRLAIESIETYNSFGADEVIRYAAAIPIPSLHLTSQAIAAAAAEKSLKAARARHIAEIPGQGAAATVNGKKVLFGRLLFLEHHLIGLGKKMAKKQPPSAVYVAIGDKLAARITMKNDVRPESPAVIQQLAASGIKDTMLVTGDSKASAAAVAKKLHISTVHPEAMPADKLRVVEAAPLRPVVYVGNGITDASVLTAADVGVAMGADGLVTNSDSADVVIVRDDLSLFALAVSIAKRTFRGTRQLVLAGSGLSFILAIAGAAGRILPVYGAAIHGVVDIAVVFAALRANRP